MLASENSTEVQLKLGCPVLERRPSIQLGSVTRTPSLHFHPPSPAWPRLLSSPPAQKGDPVLALTDSLLRDVTDARPSSRYQ